MSSLVSREENISDDEYVVRRYRPDDRARFLSLYEEVFGKSRSPEWFEWRYGGPYADVPRMVLAERGDELVGAEPFISFAVRGGDETVYAVQPADAMVHPDHRREGLLTRMTEHALDRYAEDGPAFVFNFPNAQAKPAYLKLGWAEVGPTATAYRVQTPSAFLDVDGAPAAAVDAVAAAARRGYDAASRAATRLGSTVAVTRHESVPADRLEALYRAAPPERLHAPRTAAFYRWRLDNPQWDAVTYTADRDGETVAAVVACTQTSGALTTTKVLDALPMAGGDGRTDAFDELLRAVVDDHADADVLGVSTDSLPASVRTRLGFLSDDRLPLSLSCSSRSAVARPVDADRDSAWTVGGRRLDERSDWRLSFLEQDMSL